MEGECELKLELFKEKKLFYESNKDYNNGG